MSPLALTGLPEVDCLVLGLSGRTLDKKRVPVIYRPSDAGGELPSFSAASLGWVIRALAASAPMGTSKPPNSMYKPKSHRVEEIEPGIWRYSDGALRYYGHPDKHNGATYRRPAALKSFTPETSKLALQAKAEIRKAKLLEAQEAIEQELMKKLKTRSGALAIAKMAGSLATGVTSDKHPLQARSATFKTLAAAGGYLQERSGATQAVQFNLTLSDEVVRSLVADGAEVVVEGGFVDIEQKES